MEIKLKQSQKTVKCSYPEVVTDLLLNVLSAESELDQGKEHFWVIGLTMSSTIKYIELVHLGGVSECPYDMKSVLRTAIYNNVPAIIVAHNHPSGSSTPSVDDTRTTRRLKEACKIVDVKLVDHIIIENKSKDYYSFQTQGLV